MRTLPFLSTLALACGAGWLLRAPIRRWTGLPTLAEWKLRSIPRERKSLAALERNGLMVALVTGQSNAGNYGPPEAFPPARGVFNFIERSLYEAKDPMLGSDGSGSSPWIRLGESLIERGRYPQVVFALAVRGGASVTGWLPGRPMHAFVMKTLADLRASGLSPTHILWMQGEADAASLSPEDYSRAFHAFLASIRSAGAEAPVYVALETRSAGIPSDAAIRRAQQSLVSSADEVLAGPDVDTLGNEYRRDGTHFNAAGLERLAELWFAIL